MDLALKDRKETVSIADAVFACPYNESLVHQVTTAYLSNGHTGTKANKSRSQVSGGGRKPYRQKGTGRARAGTRSSPLWQGGGVTFAASPIQRKQKVNRKMYRRAMCSILSELVRQNRLSAVAEFPLTSSKTKTLLQTLKKLELDNVLIVNESSSEELELASRNLNNVEVLAATDINPVSLIKHDAVLMTVPALKKCEVALS